MAEFKWEVEVVAIQASAEKCASETPMGTRMISKAQRDRLRIVIEEVLETRDRDTRLAVIGAVYPMSGLTGREVESFNDLSMAQAHALIGYLYGHDGLSLDSELTGHGRALLEALRDHVGAVPEAPLGRKALYEIAEAF